MLIQNYKKWVRGRHTHTVIQVWKREKKNKNKKKTTNIETVRIPTNKRSYSEFRLDSMDNKTNEPRHDKTNKISVRPAKTQISLGIRPVWSESSLSAWRNLGSLATH